MAALVVLGMYVIGSLTFRTVASAEAPRETAERYNQNSEVPGCNFTTCPPPTCRCVSLHHPGDFPLEEVPQMVMLTFDDGVRRDNYQFYEKLKQEKLVNPNGCPMRMTFFVTDDSGENDYALVKKLYEEGHEIASHSQSHREPANWWSKANVQNLIFEFEGQRQNLVQRSGIPYAHIKGIRVPYLAFPGNPLMDMMEEEDFAYDSSLVGYGRVLEGEKALWPFTLDFNPPISMFSQGISPTQNYPGLWEIPLPFYSCTTPNSTEVVHYWMLDQCQLPESTEIILTYLRRHFREFQKTRTPMGLYIHSSWFVINSASFDALTQFLHELRSLSEVWLVSTGQLLDWMKAPWPVSQLDRLKSWNC